MPPSSMPHPNVIRVSGVPHEVGENEHERHLPYAGDMGESEMGRWM